MRTEHVLDELVAVAGHRGALMWPWADGPEARRHADGRRAGRVVPVSLWQRRQVVAAAAAAVSLVAR